MTHQDIAAALRALSEVLAEEVRRAVKEQLQAHPAERAGEPRVTVDGVDDARMLTLAARAIQMYAETHPRPTQVTQAQAAEMLGIHRHTVAKLIMAGELRLNRCGMIPVEQVDRVRSTPPF